MSNVIPFTYKSQQISFDLEGWINATEAARPFGKRPVDWLRQKETEEYIATVADFFKCEPDALLKSKAGRYGGGTWLHPKLAIAFARWLDVKFSVWCDFQIDALLRGELQAKKNYANAHLALVQAKEKASKGGKDLASWRWHKEELKQQVGYWGEQLKLTLAS